MKIRTKKKMAPVMALSVAFTTLLSGLFPIPLARSQAQTTVATQDKRQGRIVKSYRETRDEKNDPLSKTKRERPAWVKSALERSLAHFNQHKERFGLQDAQADLRLLAADEDDLGLTHIRLDQYHKGVEVFGGQLIAHLDAESVRDVSGRVFGDARIDTTPALSVEQAIAAATAALGFAGEFASQPKAKLVALPHRFFKHENEQGATLVYRVALKTIDEAPGPARHQYFVDAKDGSIVWHYNSMPSVWGGGNSAYSGRVSISTEPLASDRYRLRDPERGYSETRDMNNQTSGAGSEFIDVDNTWGDGALTNRQTVAVDVQYGVRTASDYFLTQHGRLGLDGYNAGIRAYVHFGVNYMNANGSKDGLIFGDGDADGSTLTPTRRPYVSLDVVGHEYTHAMIDYIIPDDGDSDSEAGFIYAGESGAVEESFADIFGTEVERYPGGNSDYLIGEDIVINGVALRNMANPSSMGHPDHYSLFVNTTSDDGGVHTNSSIMNHAYYLLAEGGTHRLSGITIQKIGYASARWIFYKALTTGLAKNARFFDVGVATLKAAADSFGFGSFTYQAVASAWYAVGVFNVPCTTCKITAKHSGKALEVSGISPYDGAPVVQWDYWGGQNQLWGITPVGDGYFRITAKHSGKALDIWGISGDNGAIAQQWYYWGGDNQKWLIVPVGGGDYAIVAKHSGKALDVSGISPYNGAQAHQWDYWGGDNQKWRLINPVAQPCPFPNC